MSFETKLQRFREAQEKRKEQKPMSKQDSKEVARRLKEQIKATTDPEQLIKLTREYNRLTNPRYGRKPSVKKAESTSLGNKTSALVAKWAGRLSHVEPEAKRIECSVINEVEERRKKPGCAEVRALVVEVEAELSEQERAIWNSGSPEVD